jgi:hypothetical protein
MLNQFGFYFFLFEIPTLLRGSVGDSQTGLEERLFRYSGGLKIESWSNSIPGFVCCIFFLLELLWKKLISSAVKIWALARSFGNLKWRHSRGVIVWLITMMLGTRYCSRESKKLLWRSRSLGDLIDEACRVYRGHILIRSLYLLIVGIGRKCHSKSSSDIHSS